MAGYRDIAFMSPIYRAAAEAALAEDVCPDCGRTVHRTPVRFDVPPPGLAGNLGHTLDCPSCDTSWSPLAWEVPEASGHRRTQRADSIVHAATGRHPMLAVWHEALVAAGHDPATLPVLVSDPLNSFPYTEEEADRFDRNGALMYMPATATNHPNRVSLGPALAAAYDAHENPYA